MTALPETAGSGTLLDSNALIWLLADDPRLGPRARGTLRSGEPGWFSSVSILEITMKTLLGRLSPPSDPTEAAGVAGLRDLPFTARHTAALAAFPELARHDPFDRMLLAQAATEGIRLLTADRVLLSRGLPSVVDARL